MYDSFVEEVDGVDNGIDPFTGDSNYEVTTTLSSRVKRLSVPWTEEWTVFKFVCCSKWAIRMPLFLKTSPEKSVSPKIILNNVVLPQPFEPTRPILSFSATEKDTSSNKTRSEKVFLTFDNDNSIFLTRKNYSMSKNFCQAARALICVLSCYINIRFSMNILEKL